MKHTIEIYAMDDERLLGYGYRIKEGNKTIAGCSGYHNKNLAVNGMVKDLISIYKGD